MKTVLEIPDTLMNEAMKLTHISTKTELVRIALENLIQKEKIRDLKNYFGKVALDIDIDSMRDR